MTDEKTAKMHFDSFLNESALMQISTLNGSKPWIATVWYCSDDKSNLFFLSKDWREHSKHIKSNPNVACAITSSFSNGPGEKVQGIQIQGKASLVKATEMIHAYKVYSKRWPQLLKIGAIEAFKGRTAGIEMYKVVPEHIVWFDEVNFPDDPRIIIL